MKTDTILLEHSVFLVPTGASQSRKKEAPIFLKRFPNLMARHLLLRAKDVCVCSQGITYLRVYDSNSLDECRSCVAHAAVCDLQVTKKRAMDTVLREKARFAHYFEGCRAYFPSGAAALLPQSLSVF